MSLTTVTIGSNSYTVYASEAEADAYLAADPNRGPTWAALAADDKKINLVSATRRIDRENYQGQKAGGDAQDTDWPRSGLVYEESGNPVTDTDVPLEVEEACILQAGTTAVDSKAAANVGSGSNIKKVEAGSAKVTYFRGTTGTTFQDQDVFSLLQQWLEGSNVTGEGLGNEAYGTCDPSAFTNDKKYNRDKGFS